MEELFAFIQYNYLKYRKRVNVILIILALILVVKWCNNQEYTSDESQCSNASAFVMAESAVKTILKAPSTAEFCKYREAVVTAVNNTYTVSGWVDAQNSFGAMLRNTFVVQLVCSDNRLEVKGIKFNDEILY